MMIEQIQWDDGVTGDDVSPQQQPASWEDQLAAWEDQLAAARQAYERLSQDYIQYSLEDEPLPVHTEQPTEYGWYMFSGYRWKSGAKGPTTHHLIRGCVEVDEVGDGYEYRGTWYGPLTMQQEAE